MKNLLAGIALTGSLTLGIVRSNAVATPVDDGVVAPVDVQWREMSMNGRTVVTGAFRHPSLDFDRARVRVRLADGKSRGPRYFRKMLDRRRRFSLKEIEGGVRLRVDARGRGNPSNWIEEIRVISYSDQGRRLGRSIHTVGGGGGGGDDTR